MIKKKDVCIQFLVKPETAEAIRQAADKAEVSLSQFCRDSLKRIVMLDKKK